MLRPSTYDDATCVNAAVEINVLGYNVAVRQRLHMAISDEIFFVNLWVISGAVRRRTAP